MEKCILAGDDGVNIRKTPKHLVRGEVRDWICGMMRPGCR